MAHRHDAVDVGMMLQPLPVPVHSDSTFDRDDMPHGMRQEFRARSYVSRSGRFPLGIRTCV